MSTRGGALARLALASAAAAALLMMTPASASALEPLLQIGSPGTGAGNFDAPYGIAIDGSGSVFVSDGSNHRINQFTASGEFVRAWGADVVPGGGVGFEVCTAATGCKTGVMGGGAGQLSLPVGITVDQAGDLYVAEFHGARISKFTANGEFLRAWGWDVVPGGGTGFEICTTGSGCKEGVGGGGAGQLSNPHGVVADQSGSIYVGEFGNRRISQFMTNGGIVRAWGFDVIPGGGTGFEVCTGSCKQGVAGDGAGQLQHPRFVAIGPSGNVFVAEDANNRISVYAPVGGFLRTMGFDVTTGGGTGFEVCTSGCKAGVAGGAAGQLNFPSGLAAAPGGELFVTDFENDRVTAFDSASGAFPRAFGFDVIPAGSTGFEVCSEATTCKSGVAGSAFGQLDSPTATAVDCAGSVYVSDQQNDRVQKFGEPGAALPPCSSSPPPPDPGPPEPEPEPIPPPLNDISFGKAKLNKRKGTARLPVNVLAPGDLVAAGKKIKRAAGEADAAETVKLLIRSKGNAREKLVDEGSARVKVNVTFTPDGGTPNTEAKQVRLRMTSSRGGG